MGLTIRIADIMRATGKAKTVIWRWQERFGKESVAGLWRDKTRPSRIPPLRPEVAERVVALTLAGPPPTASHWIGAYGDRGHAGGVSHQGLPRGSAERLRGSWSVFNPSSLPGCRNNRPAVAAGAFLSIPGPRCGGFRTRLRRTSLRSTPSCLALAWGERRNCCSTSCLH